MTIVVYQAALDPTVLNVTAGSLMYHITQALKAVGWTVVGSTNPGCTAGGMDGVDRTAPIASVLKSWSLLQSPHALASDRVQILLSRQYNLIQNFLYTGYDPQAQYTGGTASVIPTSSTGVIVGARWTTDLYWGDNNLSYSKLLTVIADNAPPYGFAALLNSKVVPGTDSTNATSSRTQGVLVFNPLTKTGPAFTGKPYCVYSSGTYWRTESNSGREPMSVNCISVAGTSSWSETLAQVTAGAAPIAAKALLWHRAGTYILAPHYTGPVYSKQALSVPLVYWVNNAYLGVSDFMRWHGSLVSSFTLLSNGASKPKTRIVFGSVTLPWDGATNPLRPT